MNREGSRQPDHNHDGSWGLVTGYMGVHAADVIVTQVEPKQCSCNRVIRGGQQISSAAHFIICVHPLAHACSDRPVKNLQREGEDRNVTENRDTRAANRTSGRNDDK